MSKAKIEYLKKNELNLEETFQWDHQRSGIKFFYRGLIFHKSGFHPIFLFLCFLYNFFTKGIDKKREKRVRSKTLFFSQVKVMKQRRRVNRFLLSAAAIVFFLLSPAFDEYQDLTDIEYLSPSPAFEKPHPEDMAPGTNDNFQKQISAIFAFAILMLFPLANLPFQLLGRPISSLLSPIAQSSILRC